jgi:hypothetical protein
MAQDWARRLSNSTSQRRTAVSLCSALEAAEETGSTRHEQSLTSRGHPYYGPEPRSSTVIIACRTSAYLRMVRGGKGGDLGAWSVRE